MFSELLLNFYGTKPSGSVNTSMILKDGGHEAGTITLMKFNIV